jgi:hypothetical protein
MLDNISWLFSGILTSIVALIIESLYKSNKQKRYFKNICALLSSELHKNYQTLQHNQENTYPLSTNIWADAFDILSRNLDREPLTKLVRVYDKIETFTSDPNNNLNREEIINAISYWEEQLKNPHNLKKSKRKKERLNSNNSNKLGTTFG